MSTQIVYIDQIIRSSIRYAKLRAFSNLFSFFLYTLYSNLAGEESQNLKSLGINKRYPSLIRIWYLSKEILMREVYYLR